MVHIRNRRSQEAVRWYVLTLPTAVGGRDNIYSSKGLDAELSRRKRCGEPLFEYFAPSYVEARKVGGKMVNTRKPLLYNYVFIHASENEIFRLKRIMPLYNLLPRVSVGEHSYFPYLSDHEMETLRWMAESYSNELPVYVPDSGRLLKGDRVRITSGSFMGMEAEVVVQPVEVIRMSWYVSLTVCGFLYLSDIVRCGFLHFIFKLFNFRIRNSSHFFTGF